MNLEKLQSFISETLLPSVIEFNCSTGRDFKNSTLEKQVEYINIQEKVVREEILETLSAYQNDIVEFLDGICDVYYTVPYLGWMLGNLNIPETIEEDSVEANILKSLEQDKVDFTSSLYALFKELHHEFTEDEIIEALNLVIENNKLKYTEDLTVAESWEFKEEYKLKKVYYDEKYWYSIENDWGKVCKYNDFPKVDLTGIVNSCVERLEKEYVESEGK